jgi:hypothetical protein
MDLSSAYAMQHIRRMGVSTVVIGSNIIRPTPRNMKETTYDRKKKKINKELNKVKESGIKYWRHQSSWQKTKYFDRDGENCVQLQVLWVY